MGSMVDGKFVSRFSPYMRGATAAWRDKSGKAVTGENYVKGGKSRGMSMEEIDAAKKSRRKGSTAFESETLGGG